MGDDGDQDSTPARDGSSSNPRRPNEIDVHVGRQLKHRRSMLGMSQEALAGRMGLTFQQIQKYERATNRIGAGRLFEFARELDVNIPYFYDGLNQGGLQQQAAAAPVGFGEDNGPRYESLLKSPEAAELLVAFSEVRDPKLRKSILDMVKNCATQRPAD